MYPQHCCCRKLQVNFHVISGDNIASHNSYLEQHNQWSNNKVILNIYTSVQETIEPVTQQNLQQAFSAAS